MRGVCDRRTVRLYLKSKNEEYPRMAPIKQPARTSLRKCMPRIIREAAMLKAHNRRKPNTSG
jgi:Putative inner membrane protein (DUF1819)